MATIKVFGPTPPCAKCKKAEEIARRVAEKFPGRVTVEKHDVLGSEADRYGMMTTPATVIDDTVVAMGKLLSEAELEKLLRDRNV